MYKAYKQYIKHYKQSANSTSTENIERTRIRLLKEKSNVSNVEKRIKTVSERDSLVAREGYCDRNHLQEFFKNKSDDQISKDKRLLYNKEPFNNKDAERRHLLSGNLDINIQSDSNLIRIFTSSTFTDTVHERNALMERVYGNLRQFCKDLGCEFQVVDMRWGIRDETTNEHMTTEICLQEIQACQKLSIGPNFVTLLSHKYGYRPLQRVIDAKEMEVILKVATEHDKTLILRWYKLDENQIPAAYVLQPISNNIPDYLDHSDRDNYKKARHQWWEESSHLLSIISKAAESIPSPEASHKYFMSVTEAEIRKALENTEESNKCLWFHRIITDINEQPPSHLVSKYRDINGEQYMQKKTDELLSNLKETTLPESLPEENIKTYRIYWTENGVDPECEQHEHYITQICSDFESMMKARIKDAVENKSTGILSTPVCAEVLQHIQFCQSKCSMFHGRQNVLEGVKKKLLSRAALPYVVYGRSGCGKTSLLAKIASQIKMWLDKPIVLILRFIGTTLQSTSLRTLLLSCAEQIKDVYGLHEGIKLESQNAEIKFIEEYFLAVIKQASESKKIKSHPLVIIFDSLDQLSNDGNPQGLKWFPRELPNNVYFMISTLPDKEQFEYGYLPKLQVVLATYKEDRFLEVPEVDTSDAKLTIESWLKAGKKSLTREQLDVVMATFNKCKLPLFMKLLFDDARNWASFTEVNESCLAASIEDAIKAMFIGVEKKHGLLLTSRTFAYITASKRGLSEVELEDILSCDDEVLNDVYQYWTPPIRRLPPLLLVRLKMDISQYLVERGSSGIKVIYWYHRQFVEAARDRYLAGENISAEQNKQIHRNIAEYFLGKWTDDTLKPFTSGKGISDAKCRFTTPQPIKTKDGYNMRKLEELAVHLVLADMFQELESDVIMNLAWHLAKIKAFSYRDLMAEIDSSIEHMSSEYDTTEWRLMRDMLRLSEEALLYNPDLLPSQALGRVTQGLEHYKEQCRQFEGYALFLTKPTLTPPGSELVYCLAGHEGQMTYVQMTQDDNYVITANEDNSIRVWDITKGSHLLTIEDCFGDRHKTQISNLFLCCADKYIVTFVDMNKNSKVEAEQRYILFVFNTKSGLLINKTEVNYSAACAVFNDNTHLAIASVGKIQLFDVDMNTFVGKAIPAEWVEMFIYKDTKLAGSQNIVCGGHEDRFIWLYDMESKQHLHCIEVVEASEAKQKRPRKKSNDVRDENKADENNRGENDDSDDDIETDSDDDVSDDEEWLTDVIAVSPNAQTILAASIYDSDLHLFSVQSGQKTGFIKGNIDDLITYGVFISNILFVACESKQKEVMLWNLEDQKLTYMFGHQESLIKALVSKDLTTVVTIAEDSILRVWKQKGNILEQSRSQATTADISEQTTSSDTSLLVEKEKVRDILTLPGSSRYVILFTDMVRISTTERQGHSCFKLIDVCTDTTMRTIFFSGQLELTKVVSDKRVLICDTSYKLHLFDIDDMCIEKSLQGFSGSPCFFFRHTSCDSEVVCLTTFCSRVKLISLSSGQTTDIIRTGLNERLADFFVVNESGNTAVVEEASDVNCFLVISLETKQPLKKLTWEHMDAINFTYFTQEYITKDGRYLIHNVVHELPGAPYGMTKYGLVWDLLEGKMDHVIYDKEHEIVQKCIKYQDGSQLSELDVDYILLLDDGARKIATTSPDNVIRIYDVVTGELEHKIDGHHIKDISSLTVSEGADEEPGKYCMSFSKLDYGIWLFEKSTWKKIACFKSDTCWESCVILSNHTVVGAEVLSAETACVRLNVLKLHCGAGEQDFSESEWQFEGNGFEKTIELPLMDKTDYDPDDPDTD